MHQVDSNRLPRHVAIIMDGNGRWARQKLRNRAFGHNEGVNRVRDILRLCLDLGIPCLTLYAFSKENWQRPSSEVRVLWRLLKRFLRSELAELTEKEVRVSHLGDVEDIPADVLREFRYVIEQTSKFDKLFLNLAINYGGRQEILRAVKLLVQDSLSGKIDLAGLSNDIFSQYLFTNGLPDPDLIIRTSGEYRVSNFLLWQMAYSEIYITNVLWPDFHEAQFMEAIAEFQSRERRFGKTGDQVHCIKSG